MKLRLVSLLALSFATALSAADEYRVLAHYQIGGDASGFDYLRVDPVARRLYIAHEKRFEVLDADTGAKIGEIGPTTRAHGVALVPDLNRGFASSGVDDQITIFDLKTLATIKVLKSSGSNPDAIEYDPDTKRVYAGNHGSGEITVIDPAAGEIVATLPLGGKLEGIGFDGRGQGYVIAEDKSLVHVFDTHTLKAKTDWTLAPGEGGTGLAVDAANHRLFAACGNKQALVLDSDTGKVVATAPIGEDPDGLTFDPKTRRVFTSNSDGTITIIQQESADKYTAIQTLTTKPRSRTITLDTKTGHVITCAPQYGPKPARVPGGPAPKAPVIPGTFEALIVGQ